jgi:hypothetical protein
MPGKCGLKMYFLPLAKMQGRLALRTAAIVATWFFPETVLLAAGSDISCMPTAATAGEPIQKLQAQLRAGRSSDEMETDVSDEASTEISALKDALGTSVAAYMDCIPTVPRPSARKVGSDLSKMLKASLTNGPESYAAVLPVRANWIPGHKNLLGVTTSIDIGCGTDTMLQLFAIQDNAPREVLRWRSPPYREISGAFDTFQYQLSAPDKSGHWFLVATHVKPWCSSTWSMMDYDVLRPREGGTQPLVLSQGSDSFWWGGSDARRFDVSVDRFDLRFTGHSIDPEVLSRITVRDFQVTGDSVRRINPVAESPRDFIDEWLVSSWRTAAMWTAPDTLAQLQNVHAKLSTDKSDRTYFTFGTIRACADSQRTAQVQVIAHDARDTSYYFRVAGKSAFVLRGVSSAPAKTCSRPLPQSNEDASLGSNE